MSDAPLRILLLDDDEDEFLIVKRLLAKASRPYEFEWTADAQVALGHMTHGDHDVYLVDYWLGALTGLEVIRAAVSAGAKAPLILLTAALGTEEGHEVDIEALRCGAADYLSKDGLTSAGLERSIRYARERAQSAALREDLGRAREEGARLQAALAQVETQARYLQLLAESSALFARAPSDLDATLNEVARKCAEVLGDACVVTVLDACQSGGIVRAFQHVDASASALGTRVLVGETIPLEGSEFGAVVRAGHPRLSAGDAAEAVVSAPERAFRARYPVHSVVTVPLRASGATLGTLAMMRGRAGASYSTDDQALLQDIADRGGLAIQNALLFKAQVDARERERAARQEAERANRAKDDFLAMLGHELRNPLTPIVTAVHLLRLRGDAEIRRELDVVDRQAQHLVRLVDDLLDVARITKGKVALNREHVELAKVVASAIEMASPLVENGQHRMDVDVPKQGLLVSADRVRLAQVLANLLTNAAKYTPRGGHIRVSASRVDGEVVVKVQDDGAGIGPELLPHVFDLFVQSHQTIDRARGGLGLGLAIVKNLVAMHSGTVHADSAGAGRGSTFTVRLPAADAMATAAIVDAEPPPSRQVNGCRILIVDDNTDAADMLSAALHALGYVTATAHDGPAALGAAESFRPDIGLLDLGLPVLDGYELAERLRSRYPGLRLIAVTGYGRDTDKRRAKEAGFCHHLTKPVEFTSLAKLLEEMAQQGQAAQQG